MCYERKRLMRRKTAEMGSQREVVYSKEHWRLLESLRSRAQKVMEALQCDGIESVVFGSIARGDVTKNSDVDLFITRRIPSFKIELCVDEVEVLERVITQATPGSLIKGHLRLAGGIDISFPLIDPTISELDFYFFAGALTCEQLCADVRKLGVDKRLMLITPTHKGHVERPVSDMSSGVLARSIGVCQRIVDERVRVLKRRRRVGITGLYLERKLAHFESFEQVLKGVVSKDAALRRRAG
jgi:hypothetical protein